MIEAPPRAHAAAPAPETPYVGLVPYREEDADFFFGRDRENRIVAGNLQTSRLTIVYGTSGVGKTSLLEAGVVRDLHDEVLANAAAGLERPPFAVCSFRAWRDDPLPALAESIRAAAVEALGGEELPPWRPGGSLVETLRAWTGRVRTLLVILDQFEDYFLYHPDEDGEGTFAVELPRIVNDPNLRVNVVLSIREDAWAKLDRFKGRIPRLFANYFRVEHLSGAAASEAIEGPVAEWNRRLPEGAAPYDLEPELVTAVVEATTVGRISLAAGADGAARETTAADVVEAPFLQLVMERVWRATVAAGSHELTLERLEALGGAQRIVETHLQEALRSLTRGEKGVAADAFRFLVTSTKTKIAHSASDLAEWTRRPEPEVAAVLDKLCRGESGRILRAVHPPGEEEATRYELFHDVLAEPILEWRRGYEQWRARRRFARIAAALLALVAVFAALGAWAVLQRNDARHATAKASSVALASSANEQLASHLDRSLLLGLAAYDASPSAAARNALVTALESARSQGVLEVLRGLPGIRGVALAPDGRTLAWWGGDRRLHLWDVRAGTARGELRTPGPIARVVFLEDGRTLAVVDGDGTVTRWNAGTLHPSGPAFRPPGTPRSVVVSPDGRTLAAVSRDGVVSLWNARDRSLIGRLPGRVAPEPLAFGPGGRTLAGVTNFLAEDRFQTSLVRLWRVSTLKQIGTVRGEDSSVVDALAFSPDGRTLATGGGYDTGGYSVATGGHVELWDEARHAPRASWSVPAAVDRLAFVRGGRTLAAGLGDGSIALSSVHRPKSPTTTLDGVEGAVSGLASGADTVAAAGAGGSAIHVWDLRARNAFARRGAGKNLLSHGVAFSPDGRTVAFGDDQGRVALVDVASGRTRGVYPLAAKPISALAFSPDRTKPMLAIGNSSGGVSLWDVPPGKAPVLRQNGNGSVDALAFSRDGGKLAVGRSSYPDGTLSLFDVTGRRPRPLAGPVKVGRIYALAFTPDGRVATAGSGGTVRLWDAERLAPRRRRPGLAPGTAVAGAAFGPDATGVAFGTAKGTVWLSSPRAGASWGELPGGFPLIDLGGEPEANVGAVAFSPDGGTLAAASSGDIGLWDVGARAPLGQTLHQSGQVSGLAFSPDGAVLASTSGGLALWKHVLWRDPQDARREVCSIVVGGLTRHEWAALAPGIAYHATCPG